MKALTLIQPWATAICDYGKRVENRSWKPPQWLIGQQLAIHAGKSMDPEGVSKLRLSPQAAADLPRGAVVAVATVAGCVGWSSVPFDQMAWFGGPHGWLLTNVQVLPEPVLCRGAQGLWDLPEDVLAKVMSQIKKESR